MIYFVRFGNLQVIKIGYSRHTDFALRRAGLRNTYDRDITVLAVSPGTRGSEAKLHNWFSPLRIVGELFQPHAALLDYAASCSDKFPLSGSGLAGDDLISCDWCETAVADREICRRCARSRNPYRPGVGPDQFVPCRAGALP